MPSSSVNRLMDATVALQRVLTGRPKTDNATPPSEHSPLTIDLLVEPMLTAPELHMGSTLRGDIDRLGLGFGGLDLRSTVPILLGKSRERRARRGAHLPGSGLAQPDTPPGVVALKGELQFVSRTFSNDSGARKYKLYIPTSYRNRALPLIIMLHGCTQSPDDFAAGTRMNILAEQHDCFVAYPAQTNAANMQKCWNWFREADQQRDSGEPSLIAGITRQVMRDYEVDPRRVYIAGLSAGGAAAAVMAETYSDLYAAVGVHSGLACGAARDMPSAFAAMRNGGTVARRPGSSARLPAQDRVVPTIVFHGDTDATVDRCNGDAVVDQAKRSVAFKKTVENSRVPGGHAYCVTRHTDLQDQSVIEQWVVHGGGHAWFGGSTSGSYTDPRGPDASAEMLRFFLEHRHPSPADAP